jgi:hypothetical protein
VEKGRAREADAGKTGGADRSRGAAEVAGIRIIFTGRLRSAIVCRPAGRYVGRSIGLVQDADSVCL